VAELHFSIESKDGCAVVTVGSELDVICSQQFDDCLTEASSGSDWVILDLSAVDFMDTTALAVIVGHWRRQVAAGGKLLLAGARYRYTKALWITGLADRLPMYADVGEALAAARLESGAGFDGGGARDSGEPETTVRLGRFVYQRYQRPREVPSPIRTRKPTSQMTSTIRAIHHRM
jgi:anti-sigma B factor antagonist